MPATIPKTGLEKQAFDAWRAGLQAVAPGALMKSLDVTAQGVVCWGGEAIFDSAGARVFCLAVGKSGGALGQAAADRLGGRLHGGFVVDAGDHAIPKGWHHAVGQHPIANASSQRAGERVLAWLGALRPQDRLLVLMSGGGSALMEVPKPGWSLGALAEERQRGLSSGWSIERINQAAASGSEIKDGGLARHCPCPWTQLTLSDVSDQPLGVVSSGPFTGLTGSSLRLGDHRVAADAAAKWLEAEGWRTLRGAQLTGEASLCGKNLTAGRPGTALIGSGETTVTGPYDGLGGRNLELVAGWLLRHQHPTRWALVAGASDGCDGSSGGSGAWARDDDLQELQSLREHLKNHDTATWFTTRGRLLPSHPPECHVGDLLVLLVGAP